MRAFRISLLINYFSYIKNKKKALLAIHIGIFLSIFAVTAASISFYIETRISKTEFKLFDLNETKVWFVNELTKMENNFNILDLDEINEERNSEDFKLLNALDFGSKIVSSYDFYLPIIYDAKQSGIFENSFYDKEGVDALLKWANDGLKKSVSSSFNDFLEDKEKASKINYEKYERLIYEISTERLINEINNPSIYSIRNYEADIFKDYKTIRDFRYSTREFEKSAMAILRGINQSITASIKKEESKIIKLSKNEKWIILSTFFLQLIIFIIIQFFEISSLNKPLIKKKII